MPEVTIHMAENGADIEKARILCREWLDWHWNAFPEDGPTDGNPMNPDAFEAVLDDLPQIHARPQGAILLAELAGMPVGCVMYHAAGKDTAEIKRLFVSEAGRGHRVGRLLLEAMFQEMYADGYRRVMFSSANFLTHARRLYESVGFEEMAQPPGFPEHFRDFVYFMERPLAPKP